MKSIFLFSAVLLTAVSFGEQIEIHARQTEKIPECSRLFSRYEDPESGVVSYLLKPKSYAFNQQSIYFTCKSMTDNGRFLLFHASNEENDGHGKRLVVLDLDSEIFHDLDKGIGLPFLDTEHDILYHVAADKTRFCRRDLLKDPKNEITVCQLPPELCPSDGDVDSLLTHLTLTKNHDKAFFDSRIRGRFIHGLVDLKTGKYEKWGETPFFANHGQLNPANDKMAMLAWECCWTGEAGDRYKKFGAVYPRMWIVEPGNRFRLIPSIRNYATHEKWSEDGKGIYFCSKGGVYFHEIDTDRQYCVSPIHAVHATMTANNRYVTFDSELEPNYRGCSWRIGFTNRETGRSIWIHSKRPALNPRERPSTMHPDPHPTFIRRDRYIVCTINNADGHMDLSITPVAQLIEKTAAK